MAKKSNEEWKAEVERAERKQRLANLKDSEGTKKKINTKSVGSRIAVVVISVLLVLVLAVWGVARFGVLQRSLKAVTITNSELPGASMTLSPADLNVEFGNVTVQAQLGLAFSDEIQDTLNEVNSNTDRTLRDEVLDLVLKQIQSNYALVLAMNSDKDFVLSAERQAEIDQTVNDFEKDMALSAQKQGVGIGNMLSNYFGPGVSSKLYMKFVRQSLLLEDYSEHLMETTEVSKEEAETYTKENEADLKTYDFSYYSFALNADEEELKDEELSNALLDLSEKANKALQLYRSGKKSFAEAMAEYEEDESAHKTLLENPDNVEMKVLGSNLSSLYLEWMTDPARQEGDTTVIQSDKSVVALAYHDSFLEDCYLYNARHILVTKDSLSKDADSDTVDDAQIKALAEKILAEYEAGEQTEDSFAALVKEYSVDTGSVDNGGLYEDVAYGKMVTPFQDWCLDETRKTGDTGIVKTSYGYHIMYFVGLSDEKSLDSRVKELLLNEKISDWQEKLINGSKVEQHNFALGFVGRTSFFSSLFAGKNTTLSTEAETTVPTTAVPTSPAETVIETIVEPTEESKATK